MKKYLKIVGGSVRFILYSSGVYNVDKTKISCSGISSGASMAQQFHVAYSSIIMGVGSVAGCKLIERFQQIYWFTQQFYTVIDTYCMPNKRFQAQNLLGQMIKWPVYQINSEFVDRACHLTCCLADGVRDHALKIFGWYDLHRQDGKFENKDLTLINSHFYLIFLKGSAMVERLAR